jgi:ribonuclease HI
MGDDESDNILTDMGAACFYPDTNISISTRLDLWPSSTRAELVAILLALLGVPADTTLHIHSDSQAAIWTIEKMSEGLLSVRKLLKSVNNLLLIKIMTVIREKHINVKFMKVKAHMGIAENEIADCLAKQAISEGIHQFNNNFISLDGIFNYFLAYEQHPIERNLGPDTEVYVLDDFYSESSNYNNDTTQTATNITRRDRYHIAARRCFSMIRKIITHNAWTSYVYPVVNTFSKLTRFIDGDL